MEKETISSPSPRKTKSNQHIWLIVAIVVLCLALVCCLLVIAGFLLLRPVWEEKTLVPDVQIVPSLPTSSDIPPTPTEPVYVDGPWILNYEADPLHGSASLQRGFSPDPYAVAVGAGGITDTSDLNLDCGFTTDAPTFAFNLSGGASEGFLRIYFVANDDTDTTLIVHTPNQEWICEDNSSYGSGMDPVIDIEYAASGKYTVWVGMHQNDTYAIGMLFITESANNTP